MQSTFSSSFRLSTLNSVSNVATYRLLNPSSNPIFPTSILSKITILDKALLNTLSASNFTFSPSATGNTARQQADIAAFSVLIKTVTDSLSLLFGVSSSSSMNQFITMQQSVLTNATALYTSIQAINVNHLLFYFIFRLKQILLLLL